MIQYVGLLTLSHSPNRNVNRERVDDDKQYKARLKLLNEPSCL